MDYSAANHSLWGIFIWLGIIAILLLSANVLNRKVRFVRQLLIPTAALAGFLLLLLRSTGLLRMPGDLLEHITYHSIAIGFIALSLKPGKQDTGGAFAMKSGALIVATYLMQAILGLMISLLLAYTFMPDLFKASGILLPMAYGQGSGQANNVGSTYEALGFVGGRSFGLSLAATGYLCACVVGVWYTRRLLRAPGQKMPDVQVVSGSVTTEIFEEEGEMPLTESVDRLSMQVALVLACYLLTYLVTRLLTDALGAVSPGLGKMLQPILWGFNFITGSIIAILVRTGINTLRSRGIMTRQYQNSYLLTRISGLAFDLMIVAGIAAIDIADLRNLWVPFLLMAVLGGIATYYFVRWLCRKLYPGFVEESFVAMYGMLTGTISSGILLLRQLDPEFHTPAADSLVVGSGTAILFGAPLLVLIAIAPQSPLMTLLTMAVASLYLAFLLWLMFRIQLGKKKA